MNVIRLTDAQRLDIDLAIASEEFSGLDADAAAYASYMLTKGEIPPDKLVARSCSDPRCVNPAHLFLVAADSAEQP
jgi:hypothetical protein